MASRALLYVAAAGTDRQVSLAPMFFGYVLRVHQNIFKRDTALMLAKAKAISCLGVVVLLTLDQEIKYTKNLIPGIQSGMPHFVLARSLFCISQHMCPMGIASCVMHIRAEECLDCPALPFLALPCLQNRHGH